MRLYIANCTKQNQVVCYRLDYDNKGELIELRKFMPARQQDIQPGRQAIIGGDMHKTQIDDIISQLRVYGLIGVVDVQKDDVPGRRITPLVFNIDAQVPKNIIERVFYGNQNIMIEDGRERRQKAAVANHELVQTSVSQQFAAVGIDEPPAERMQVSFEQEEQTEAGEKRIEEGYTIVPEKQAPPTAPRGFGRGRKKA
jgi:hypothetical protein